MKVLDIFTELPLIKKFTVLEKGIKVITDDKDHPYPHSRLGPDVDIGSHEDTTHPYVIPNSQQVDDEGKPIYGAEAGMRWYGQEMPFRPESDIDEIMKIIGELEGEIEDGEGWGDEEGSGYVQHGDGDAGAGSGEGYSDIEGGHGHGDGTGEGPYTGKHGDYGAGDGDDVGDAARDDTEDGGDVGDDTGEFVPDEKDHGDGPSDDGPTTQGDPDAQAGPLTPEIRKDPEVVVPPVVITPTKPKDDDKPKADDDDKPEADYDDPLEHGHGTTVHSHEDGDIEHDHNEDPPKTEPKDKDDKDDTDTDLPDDRPEGESSIDMEPGEDPKGGPGTGEDETGTIEEPKVDTEDPGKDMGPIEGPADPNVFVAKLNPDGSWKISPEELELQLSVIQARQYSQNEGNHFTDVRFPHMSFDGNGELSAMFPPDGKPTLFMGSGPTRTELDRGTYDSGKPIPDYYYFSNLTTAVRDTEHVEGYIDPVDGVWPDEVLAIAKQQKESIDFSRLEKKLNEIMSST